MTEPTVVVGRIAKAHGVRGEVAVEVRSDNPHRFADGASVFLEDGRTLTVNASRSHSGRLLVMFEGVLDRSAADALRGKMLVVPESMLPELPQGEYWPHQLAGCDVVTEMGRALGSIAEVIPNPSNDLWVAKDAAGHETLVPARKEVVVEVDIAGKRIVVRDIPGLTAADET